MKLNIKLSILLSCLTLVSVFAQDDDGNLGSEDIIVVKDYEARIDDAKKIKINPSVPEIPIQAPQLSYDVPSKLMELKYPPHTLKPYSMPKVKLENYNHSYIRLGFGTQFTPLAEIVYLNKDADNIEFGGFYKHLSSNGKRENQNFRNNDLGLIAKGILNKTEIGGHFDFTQNVDYFYGYNESDTSFTSKEVKHRLRIIGGDLYIKNATLNKKNFDHKQVIKTSFTNDNFQVNEWYVNYNAKFTKIFKNQHFVDILGDVDVSNYIPSAPNRGDLEREVFQIGGAYTFNNDDWKLSAGLNAAIGDVNDDQQFNIYPKLYTEKRLFKNYLIFYSGWSRRLQKNTYQDFALENPFINYDIMLENSRVEDRVAGFKGSVKQFTYNARFSNKVIKNMPLFVNDSTDMKRFDVVYDKNTTVINLNFEAGYDFNKKFRSLLNLDFTLYEPDGQEKAWHLPMINTSLSFHYLLKEKLLLRSDFYGIAGAFARDVNGDAQKIKGKVDINIGADYQFTKYLSFFVQLNNLANFKYQEWYNYPTFGFNGMVGVQFRY